MNKSWFLALIGLFYLSLVYGQDRIVFNNGDTIKAKILEVSEVTVKYKYHNEPDGPVYTSNKNKINKIIYASGREEVIAEEVKRDSVVVNTKYSDLEVETYEDVAITFSKSDVIGLTDLGVVMGEGGGLTNEKAAEQAMKRLKKQAFEKGAKVVLITVSVSNYFGTWNYQGIAYE